MWIKRVILEGFKSYKDRTIIEFDNCANVVVGKNGSGKSNIFFAIQFVLSNKYATLRSEERQQLLHEGTGRAVLSAYVELIFDNESQRLPVDKPEVSLKRTIGLKKDEYFLDNKHTTKQDVESLLESAGLSRQNPYYIVAQGKVTQLIKHKDSERLGLLKEIAGTRVYDERRKESLKIMHDTENRRKQIQEIIKYLEQRLEELSEEKEELEQFQKQDRQRRALEYTIYSKEIEDANRKIQRISQKKDNQKEQLQEIQDAIEDRKHKREKIQSTVQKIEEQLKSYALDKTKYGQEMRRLQAKEATLQVQLDERRQSTTSAKTQRKIMTEKLEMVKERIVGQRMKLEELSPQYNQKVEEEQQLKDKLKTHEGRKNHLYEKVNRGKSFASKAERDAHLQSEVQRLQDQVGQELESSKQENRMVEQLNGSVQQREQRVQTLQAREATADQEFLKLDEEYTGLKAQRNETTTQRKKSWKKLQDLKQRMRDTNADMQKEKQEFRHTMNHRMFESLENTRRIVNQNRIPGVFGPIIELFEVEERFRTAVETVAGNRLFYWVVDSDATASRILKILDRENAGRVTFMPLNRLSARNKNYPQTSDAIPMIDKLKFEPNLRPAMNQIFGGSLICRNLSIANEFARNAGFDTVTLDGSQVNKRGAITGGYTKRVRSRLKCMANLKFLTQELKKIEAEHAQNERAAKETDTACSKILSGIQRLENQRNRMRQTRTECQQNVREERAEMASERDRVQQAQRNVRICESNIKDIQLRTAALKEEMASVMTNVLSEADQGELARLNEEIAQLKEEVAEASAARMEVEVAKSGVEDLLNQNLLKQEEKIARDLAELGDEEQNESLDNMEHELSQVSDSLKDVSGRHQEAEEYCDKNETEKATHQEAIDKLKAEQDKFEHQLREAGKSTEKRRTDMESFKKTREQAQEKLDNVGSLASDESFEKYKEHRPNQLMKLLKKVNSELKKYSHVNKKALDQWNSFTDQRESLLKRKQEQDTGKTAIEELIDHLDKKKDEAIQRTFKSIAKHFSIVFKELVPRGKGTFVMYKKSVVEEEDDEKNPEPRMKSRADAYTGVGIKVQFTNSGEVYTMQQLSGGQQTVVALTLIFAIQRCDPSPFYIFDEIDAALDAVYRTAVANMVSYMSEKSQFICTTFRQELLQAADRFLKVTYENKVSRCQPCSHEDAAHIIAEEEAEVAGR